VSARRGPLTLTRLFVKGSPPKDLRQRYLQAVRLRAFVPLKAEEEHVEASGWCVMERPFDLEFDAGKIFEDQYLVLGLRVDRFRVPAAIVRAELATEEQRLLSKSGKNRVSRNERLELRDKIVLRLRKKFPPSTRCLDVVWDLDGGTVLFFSHSRRTLADFAALFEKTFGLALDEDSPYLAAQRSELPERLLKRLSNVAPIDISQGRKAAAAARSATPAPVEKKAAPPSAEAEGEGEPVDELFQRVETTRFLGPEFLLWLWLRAEFVDTPIELDDTGSYEVWLDQALTLESPLDRNERVTIRGAAPTDAEEGREAVRARKFPVRARIILQGSARDFKCGLVAPRLGIAAASVPAVLNSEASEAFVERMNLAGELFKALDRLYALFLRDRLGEPWKAGWEPAIASWLEEQAIPASALAQLNPAGARSSKKRSRA
jgi:recombination associated protein RdgC